jgi:CBS domain containing-hemolysin-like protein
VIFVIFMIIAYFFAFAESATIAAQRVLLHHAGTEGDPRAKLVESFRNNPRRFFGTTLIGTNICIIVMSAVGAHTLLPGWGLHIVLATLIVDIVILIFAEITPKILSLSHPTLNAMKISRSLDIASKILAPVTWLITYLPSKMFNIDHIFHSGPGKIITEEQIVHMIGVSAKQGSIDTSEGERAVKVFKFGDTTVDEVMTPRADMVIITSGDSIRKALHIVNASGYSRLPVISPDGSDALGVFAAKDVLKLAQEGKLGDSVDHHVRDARFISETKNILKLLEEFRSSGEQIAIVVNEFGTITGVVTLEDLLEEILGEIYDEFDSDEPGAKWVMGNLVIPGSYPIEKLADRLGVVIPEGEYDTAAGFILHKLGNVPRPGESIDLGGWKLIATHIARQRITRITAQRIDVAVKK